MQIRTDFPHRVRVIENTWIPMPDGVRLGARLWLPEDAEQNPVPAVLEYIPYRKDDGTAGRDAILHPYFAGCGYAAVRVDLRGSGDSDGLLLDEYLQQELDDGVEVVKWLAAQPWCSGNVGIIGKSWGGFNGLQIAALRPPELKAVISVCSTDDRYADDVHHMGGCILAVELLSWASTMFAANGRPPDPRHVGDRWREMWLDRLENTPPNIEPWLTHSRFDAFWKHGSVGENFADITCPVYMVGGWADPYTNAIQRTLAGLRGPRKGLIGPWSHNYPESGSPGPAIGFLQECVRWWDYWLKGIDNGIMAEPMLRAWVQDSVPPATGYAERPGRWVAEPAWPSPQIGEPILHLNPGGTLDAEAAPEGEARLCGSLATGMDAGAWLTRGIPGDFPPDQRADDGRSLTFTSAPLAEGEAILGFPEVTLALASDKPNALVAIRLCDVAPSGESTLVTRGLLNLTHRNGHEAPEALEPGKRYTVTVRLNAIGYALPAGHSWRVAVSPTYWPWAWPSPELVTLTLFPGPECRLTLSVRPPNSADASLPAFGPAEKPAPPDIQTVRTGSRSRKVEQDTITGRLTMIEQFDGGRLHYPGGAEYETISTNTYSIVEGDPLSAKVRCDWLILLGRDEWQTRIETVSEMTSDAEFFHVTNVLYAYEGNVRVFAHTWAHRVPRDHN